MSIACMYVWTWLSMTSILKKHSKSMKIWSDQFTMIWEKLLEFKIILVLFFWLPAISDLMFHTFDMQLEGIKLRAVDKVAEETYLFERNISLTLFHPKSSVYYLSRELFQLVHNYTQIIIDTIPQNSSKIPCKLYLSIPGQNCSFIVYPTEAI